MEERDEKGPHISQWTESKGWLECVMLVGKRILCCLAKGQPEQSLFEIDK